MEMRACEPIDQIVQESSDFSPVAHRALHRSAESAAQSEFRCRLSPFIARKIDTIQSGRVRHPIARKRKRRSLSESGSASASNTMKPFGSAEWAL
jgi:hypothetical protein